MNFKVISYYCDVDDSKYYEKSYHRLKNKLDEYGYDYYIEELESLGSYKENCRRKPQYILDKLSEFDEDLLWLDIDTILLNRMTELETLDLDTDLIFASAIPQIIGIKASPIVFKNNENVRDFLQHWKTLIDISRDNEQECFDHEVLFQTVFDKKDTCNVGALGYNYCTWPGDENENTVILMGLSDVESKKDSLRKMGFEEDKIDWQSRGLYYE
tara:strand:- start:2090 stop:2731 length:642 start_codon:yes stop_codon:yes gene_type:complete